MNCIVSSGFNWGRAYALGVVMLVFTLRMNPE